MVERHMVGVIIERDDEDGSWVRYSDYQALESKLEAMRISHPTDICECRFDFGDYKEGEPPKMRNVCKYHAEILSRLEAYEKWFRDNAALLATHRIGGYEFVVCQHCGLLAGHTRICPTVVERPYPITV